MIHFDRNGNGAVAPISLTGVAKKTANDQKLDDELGQARDESRPMKFKSSIYGHVSVKSQLKLIAYDKCSYCDSRIADVAYGDVEHFRPKSKYWWLAYTWENLLYACQICNGTYKSAHFPLKGRKASGRRSNLQNENHLLINPLDVNPEEYISYDVDGDGVSIIHKNNNVKERIDKCIEHYGINREKLIDSRRMVIEYLKTFYSLYVDSSTAEDSKNMIKQQFRKMKASRAEFAGMVRFYLSYWGINI